jgi:hypothetical protein
MKFLRPDDSAVALSDDVLKLGENFQLIHSSLWKKRACDPTVACWSNELEPGDVLRVITDGATCSVLQSDPEDFSEDVRAWVGIRENSSTYFQDPIRALLPSAKLARPLIITDAIEKETLRLAINRYSAQFGNKGCQEACEAIFEEMFMNAMLDAPQESSIKKPGSRVSFFLGCDERRLGIACQDAYGSLKIEKLLSRMKEVYEKGAGAAINMENSGGAGLGCTIMVEKSSLIAFGVQPGQSTVVSCLIHRKSSNRHRSELKKSLHLITNG